jgi:hypothetical protein
MSSRVNNKQFHHILKAHRITHSKTLCLIISNKINLHLTNCNNSTHIKDKYNKNSKNNILKRNPNWIKN